MAELKPCPFCGSKNIIIEDSLGYWCKCETCKAESAISFKKQEAVEAWNRRVKE